jgi:hypothetical protein
MHEADKILNLARIPVPPREYLEIPAGVEPAFAGLQPAALPLG